MPRDHQLNPPTAGEDTRRLWRSVAELVQRERELRTELARLKTALEDLRNKPVLIPGAGGGGGIRWRGEWTDTLTVAANDMVKVSSGVQAGVYLAVATPPLAWNPWAGVYYVLLARPTDQVWA